MTRFFAHRPTHDPAECQVYACEPMDEEDLLGIFPDAERISRAEALALHCDTARFGGLYDDGEDRPPEGFRSAARNCVRSTRRLLG